jgi:hypothetical protein
MCRLFHAPGPFAYFGNQKALALPVVVGIVLALFSVRVARADDLNLDPEQIKAALHTTSDIEGGFVTQTVTMVKAGTLPRDLFTSCFIWARKKPRHQFQYFKQALTFRAAEIGVTL